MIGFIHIVDWHDLFSGLISPRGRVCSKISALIIVEESPAIGIRKNYRETHVVEILEYGAAAFGYPKTIRIDNGPEFVSKELDL